MRERATFKVINNKQLNHNTYLLKFERNNISFQTGQYLLVGPKNYNEMREYSIFSPEDANYLEILFRVVDSGEVTNRLKKLKEGDELLVQGAFGYFLLNNENIEANKLHYLIATGTGVAPFHSFVSSKPSLKYKVLHGIRDLSESYESDKFGSNYVSCISRSNTGLYKGRVTDYLRENLETHSHALFYLCGNCDMIYEIFDILRDKGISSSNIFTEVYF